METRYLMTLVAVVETGSFTRAASDLCITQAAVSQRIRLLEDYFGQQLVKRSGRLVAPTEAGSRVMAKAGRILALERELEDELKGVARTTRLSFCCTPTFGIVYLPGALNRFFLANSDTVDLKCMLVPPEQALKGVQRGDFDLAVIEHCRQLTSGDTAMRELPPDQLAFISSPALGLPEGTVPLELLLGQRLIARRDGCSSRCLLEENLALGGRNLRDFRGMIIHDDLHLTLQGVLAGRGVAFVSLSLVRDLIAEGKVLSHRVDGFVNFRSRSLLLGGRESDLLTEFAACLEQAVDLPGISSSS